MILIINFKFQFYHNFSTSTNPQKISQDPQYQAGRLLDTLPRREVLPCMICSRFSDEAGKNSGQHDQDETHTQKICLLIPAELLLLLYPVPGAGQGTNQILTSHPGLCICLAGK